MAFLDIVLGLMLVYGLYKGFTNGLFIEIASILALVAGLYGAFHFSDITAHYLDRELGWNPSYMNVVAFLITFFLIVILVQVLGRLLTKMADLALLGMLNRIAGAVFGTLKVAVILGALIIFFERANHSFHFLDDETKAASTLYAPLKEVGALVFGAFFPADPEPEESEVYYL